MLNIFKQIVVMASVIFPNDFMFGEIILSVVMLNAFYIECLYAECHYT
jgi:hypothetical protein